MTPDAIPGMEAVYKVLYIIPPYLASWVDGGEDDVIIPVGCFDSCASESGSVCPGTGFALLSPVTPWHPRAPAAATPGPLRAVEQYAVTEVRG